MRFDEVLDHIGGFGFYQKRFCFLIWITAIFNAIQSLSILFILDIPLHRCYLGENDTYEIQNEAHSSLINISIPWEVEDGKPVLSSCYRYSGLSGGTNDNTTEKCTAWVYDKSRYETTMTEEYSIVCDRRMLRSHSNMVGYAGTLFGTMLMGILSDMFGRRPIFLINAVCQSAVFIGISFSPNIYVYMALRFVLMFAANASFTTTFVMVMEMSGTSKRVFVGIAIEYFWCLGLFLLGLVAYFIRDWQTLNLIISVPTSLYVFYYWIIPESPRWLISRNRLTEARVIIKKMATDNGTSISQEMLEKITMDEKQKSVKFTQVFASKSLLFITLTVFFNWFVVSVDYYGLNLNIQNLSGNIYLNYTISSLMELISYLICIVLLDRVGRKILHCGSMLLAGVACLAIMFPVQYGGPDWVPVMLSNIGRLGASGAYGIIFIYTAELFPTSVRQTAVGTSAFFAGIGSMVAPYIADLGILVGGNLKKALPLMVFGTISIAAGLLAIGLPETLNQELPETIEDAKNMKRKKKNNYQVTTNGETLPTPRKDIVLNSHDNTAFELNPIDAVS